MTSALYTRPASPADRPALSQLLNSGARTHTHLDWQSPPAWLGHRPFHLALVGNTPVGALAAPPDPPDVAWLRLVAAAQDYAPAEVLDPLWAVTRQALIELSVAEADCMLLDDWLGSLLHRWQFEQVNEVVVLRRGRGAAPAPYEAWRRAAAPVPVRVRPAQSADLRAIALVDAAAFQPPWQYSPAVLSLAMAAAEFVSVAEVDGELVGYQVSTGGRGGGHLARLAVQSSWQGQGIGRALLSAVIDHFDGLAAPTVTVNTQSDNPVSHSLYRAFGFEPTGEHYPVWRHRLTRLRATGR